MSAPDRRTNETPFNQFKLEQYTDLLKQRIILLNTDIDEDIVETLIVQIIKMDDKRKQPIRILINSYGGEVYEMGFAIDTILACKSPVITVAGGKCMSAAFDIFLAGDRRLVMPNSVLLCHVGSMSLPEDRLPMQFDKVKHMEFLMENWIKYYASRTKKDEAFWRAKMVSGKDEFISSEQALEWGIATGIFKGWK